MWQLVIILPLYFVVKYFLDKQQEKYDKIYINSLLTKLGIRNVEKHLKYSHNKYTKKQLATFKKELYKDKVVVLKHRKKEK